jgi:putative membrane protein
MTEPDPRFTLANERTFLAWIRTALALIAAGVAVDEFVGLRTTLERLALSVPLMALGAVIAFRSPRRWRDIQTALRTGTALPAPDIIGVVGSVLCVVALIAILVLVARP